MPFKEKLLIGVAILYFTVSTGYIKSVNKTNSKEHNNYVEGISNKKRETKRLKLETSELSSILEKQKKDIKSIEEIQSRLYEIEKFNNFVKEFEDIRKGYRGADKVGYELIEEEGRAVISLSYRKSYNRLKEFIYDLEKTFPFLEVSYLNMEKDSNYIKGNLNIQIYFRRSSNEG